MEYSGTSGCRIPRLRYVSWCFEMEVVTTSRTSPTSSYSLTIELEPSRVLGPK